MGTALSSYEWACFVEDEPIFDEVITVKEYTKRFYIILLHDEAQVFDGVYYDEIMKIWTKPKKKRKHEIPDAK